MPIGLRESSDINHPTAKLKYCQRMPSDNCLKNESDLSRHHKYGTDGFRIVNAFSTRQSEPIVIIATRSKSPPTIST